MKRSAIDEINKEFDRARNLGGDGARRVIAEVMAHREKTEKLDALRLRLDQWVKDGLSLYGDLDDQDDGSYAIHEIQDAIINGLGRIIHTQE